MHEHASRRSRFRTRNRQGPAAAAAPAESTPSGSSPITTRSQNENQQRKAATPDLAPDSESDQKLVRDKFLPKRFIIDLRCCQDIKPKSIVDNNHSTPRSVSHLSQSKVLQVRSGSGRDNHAMPASQTLRRSNESSMDIDFDVTCTLHDPTKYRDVYDFLETSKPPMTHLMDAFIDFGCINAEFLLAVSSWSFEGIRGALDQLSFRPDASGGRKLT
jgi:hypothetical protein